MLFSDSRGTIQAVGRKVIAGARRDASRGSTGEPARRLRTFFAPGACFLRRARSHGRSVAMSEAKPPPPEEDELDELPPIDGDGGDEADDELMPEELDDDPEDGAADPLDDSTGE